MNDGDAPELYRLQTHNKATGEETTQRFNSLEDAESKVKLYEATWPDFHLVEWQIVQEPVAE